MGDSPEENDSIRFFPLLLCTTRFHCTSIQSFQSSNNDKHTIKHEWRCSNSQQEEVRQQQDDAKWEVWNEYGKCCYSPVFTARAYARAVLGVVILSVCPSVTRVDCDKTKWRTVDIFIPHERAITLLLWYQEWLVGDAPFPLKSAFKVTHPPSKNADFDQFPLITSQP